MPKRIIGLGHAAGTGKDTLAGYLVENHGYIKLNLADAVRDLAYYLYPDVAKAVDRVGWEKAKREVDGIRDKLVLIGNGCRVLLYDSVWLDVMECKMEPFDRVVIPDIRYPNEMDWLRQSWCGIAVRVNRPGYKPLDNVADYALVGYSWDDEVDNDSDMVHLAAEAARLAARMENNPQVESSKAAAIRRIEPL